MTPFEAKHVSPASRLAIMSVASLGAGLAVWAWASFLRPIDLWLGNPWVLASTVAYWTPTILLAWPLLRVRGTRGLDSERRKQGLVFGFLGLAGAHLLAMGTVSWLNASFDRSPAQVWKVLVLGKSIGIKPTRRSFRFKEELSVRSWRPGREIENLRLDQASQDAARPGIDRLRVVTRAGFLGMERTIAIELMREP